MKISLPIGTHNIDITVGIVLSISAVLFIFGGRYSFWSINEVWVLSLSIFTWSVSASIFSLLVRQGSHSMAYIPLIYAEAYSFIARRRVFRDE